MQRGSDNEEEDVDVAEDELSENTSVNRYSEDRGFFEEADDSLDYIVGYESTAWVSDNEQPH